MQDSCVRRRELFFSLVNPTFLPAYRTEQNSAQVKENTTRIQTLAFLENTLGKYDHLPYLRRSWDDRSLTTFVGT